jgi:hypothetical protein
MGLPAPEQFKQLDCPCAPMIFLTAVEQMGHPSSSVFPESQFTAENFVCRRRAQLEVARHNFYRSKRISRDELAQDVANDDHWSA